MAHIVGHSDDRGPRADPSRPPEQRNLAENLILLCPTHHVLVDAQDSTYTVAELRRWKAEQERFVRDALGAKVRAVGFAELELAMRNLLATPSEPLDQILPPLEPREKMALNGMSSATASTLNVGYLRYSDVDTFVGRTETIEPGYGDKLAGGFRAEYRELVERGLTGDALFISLADWSAQGRTDLGGKAAGVAVLTYLFHICDVFKS
jgi:hypothetical protein